MQTGDRLNALRAEKGMSQYRLSKLSGVAQSMISGIESGDKNPTVETLAQLCNALGVTLAEFFSPADEPEAASEEARPGDEWEPLAVRFEDGSIRPPEDLSPEQQAEIERLTKEFQEFLAWKLRKSNDHRD